MTEMTKNSIESLRAAAFGLPVSKPNPHDSRTRLQRCLLDVVLPGLALLSMSALTVTMIVVVVTTVAHGGWLTPGTYVSVDPWETVAPGPANLREDDILYPDVVTGQGSQERDPSFDVAARTASDTGSTAAQLPE
ncbi:MAG: hypothetical protein ACM3VT_13415 [Solirubrobacterales bacterium]